MRMITIRITDLGYEELLKTATVRGVSIAEIAEQRLTEAGVYEPDLKVNLDAPYTETQAMEEEHNNADRHALSKWQRSMAPPAANRATKNRVRS